MRITVESAGFTQAADACRATNELAAMVTESLAGKLAGYGGMAGNDSTSLAFAGSYDDAASQALTTLTELTHAFIGLGRLIEATDANHRAAEEASSGRPPTGQHRDDRYVRVSPADPPPCLGGQEPSLGVIDAWILDQVEGFVWPGADTGLLYDAAITWRSAASSIEHLDHHLDTVVDLLARQRSPEIPLALDVLANVRAMISDTADHLSDLGQACEDYATAVEEARDRTRALLAEIGQMIIEGAALSVLVAGFTGGLGGGAAATAAISRITARAPRFHAILTALRTVATTAATRARTARDGLRDVRTRAEKLARIPVRNERGAMKHPLGWGGNRAPGWLRGHEVPPGHTLEKHVGKSFDELMERIVREGKKRVSTFDDEASAERMVDEALAISRRNLQEWVDRGGDSSLVIDLDLAKRTGMSVLADGSSVTTTGVRIVLIPKPGTSLGWQILTAYPR